MTFYDQDSGQTARFSRLSLYVALIVAKSAITNKPNGLVDAKYGPVGFLQRWIPYVFRWGLGDQCMSTEAAYRSEVVDLCLSAYVIGMPY